MAAIVEEPNDTSVDGMDFFSFFSGFCPLTFRGTESVPLLGQRDAPQSLFARVSALTQGLYECIKCNDVINVLYISQ